LNNKYFENHHNYRRKAPVYKAFSFEKARKGKLELITIHTGQHYDPNMSEVFFDQLKMNKPNYMLNVGSGNHGVQTAKMMVDIEKIVEDEKPRPMRKNE
jgi:UDP-GlcNAc3NAcA epimerase